MKTENKEAASNSRLGFFDSLEFRGPGTGHYYSYSKDNIRDLVVKEERKLIFKFLSCTKIYARYFTNVISFNKVPHEH